jgi:hypothetical protein
MSKAASRRVAAALLDAEREVASSAEKTVGPKEAKKPPTTKAAKGAPKTRRDGRAALRSIGPKHRLFNELLPECKFDHVEAYKRAYGCTKAQAEKAAPSLLLDPLFQQYRESTLVPMLESLEADRAYVGRQTYLLTKANVVDYFEPEEVQVPALDKKGQATTVTEKRMRLKDLTKIPEWQQRNIKELKVEDTQHGQKIQIKVVDRQRALQSVGQALGLFNTDDSDQKSSVVDRIKLASSRAEQHAAEERQRRIDSGEMVDAGGTLIDAEDADFEVLDE